MMPKPITEEDVFLDEDDVYQEEVLKFLDTVNKKSKKSKYPEDSTMENPDEPLNSMRKSPSIVNAFNDMRISGASHMKNGGESKRMLNATSRKNLTTLLN